MPDSSTQLNFLSAAIKKIPLEDSQPFADFLKNLNHKNKSLKGISIHINWHFTDVNFLILEDLIAAGAKVTVSAIDGLACHQHLLGYLRDAGISYFTSLKEIQKYYEKNSCDVYLDCGAKLLGKLRPNRFGVELTHTDPKLYEGIDYPVINLDSSTSKLIETTGGTGDGLCRALIHNVLKGKIIPKSLLDILRKEIVTRGKKIFSDKQGNLDNTTTSDLLKEFSKNDQTSLVKMALAKEKYWIFGFGKVGQGIWRALIEIGVPPTNISVVDPNKQAYEEARSKGLHAYYLEESNPESIQKIKKKLQEEAACVIGATGRPDSIHKYFSVDNFNENTRFVNMSTEDDFGLTFPTNRFVAGRREIFNFGLEYPTKLEYLAPPFGLAIETVKNNVKKINLPSGLQETNAEDDGAVLKSWEQVYSRDHRRLLNDKDFSKSLDRRNPSNSPPTSPRKSTRSKSVVTLINPRGEMLGSKATYSDVKQHIYSPPLIKNRREFDTGSPPKKQKCDNNDQLKTSQNQQDKLSYSLLQSPLEDTQDDLELSRLSESAKALRLRPGLSLFGSSLTKTDSNQSLPLGVGSRTNSPLLEKLERGGLDKEDGICPVGLRFSSQQSKV